ncbi:Dehydration-responsive element-binding protein 1J [Dichanthelium oligosanthes]|uniref:Dehydration-responsive element-binding protein 1J n=1 Tax=Dichanthelium oligosanthes TaxID=888268 RepID=A0A1E5W1J2_9POAL|nr:Dehydration-responsive element-binding protein 1J [Dichanthelium oligosanthes]
MMCQLKQESGSCESATSSAASTPSSSSAVRAKRPAGRTKFRETRHPVFRGVRRRGGRAGRPWRWVCEVRVPGRRGCRLWLGTFDAAEAAARAHDAAMLAIRGACGAAAARCLNFPDSAWLLDVPPRAALRGTEVDVRRAVARAVEAFLRLRPHVEDAMSGTSEAPAAGENDDAATEADASSAKSDEATSPFEMDVLSDMGAGLYYASMAQGLLDEATSPFEMDVLSDMGAGLYYASMAQGLLMDPPASDGSCCDDADCDAATVAIAAASRPLPQLSVEASGWIKLTLCIYRAATRVSTCPRNGQLLQRLFFSFPRPPPPLAHPLCAPRRLPPPRAPPPLPRRRGGGEGVVAAAAEDIGAARAGRVRPVAVVRAAASGGFYTGGTAQRRSAWSGVRARGVGTGGGGGGARGVRRGGSGAAARGRSGGRRHAAGVGAVGAAREAAVAVVVRPGCPSPPRRQPAPAPHPATRTTPGSAPPGSAPRRLTPRRRHTVESRGEAARGSGDALGAGSGGGGRCSSSRRTSSAAGEEQRSGNLQVAAEAMRGRMGDEATFNVCIYVSADCSPSPGPRSNSEQQVGSSSSSMDYFKSATGTEAPGSTSAEERAGSGQPSPPKRPAGRTKFQETRHPVFRGVRRRGRAGRWVCEVRVPGSRGDRLWVGTFDTAEAAARAHDAAMLALCGAAARLNFPDSAWLLDVPRAATSNAPAELPPLPDVQRAATEAVAGFLRRHGGDAPAGDAASPQRTRNAASSSATVETPATGSVLDNGSMLELDVFGGMDAGSYYASLAEGLLIDPPPTSVECPEEDEDCDAGEVELWS